MTRTQHVDVARAAADSPGVALARQPDPLVVVDARRHLDLALAAVDDEPGAVAGVARVLDHDASAGALRAGLGPDELRRTRCG